MSKPSYEELAEMAETRGTYLFGTLIAAGVLAVIAVWGWVRG